MYTQKGKSATWSCSLPLLTQPLRDTQTTKHRGKQKPRNATCYERLESPGAVCLLLLGRILCLEEGVVLDRVWLATDVFRQGRIGWHMVYNDG